METSTLSSAASQPLRRPGFTIPGYAAAAARKGHEMGACRRWTPEEAREHGRRAADAARKKREA